MGPKSLNIIILNINHSHIFKPRNYGLDSYQKYIKCLEMIIDSVSNERQNKRRKKNIL